MMLNCQDVRPSLSAFIDDDLSGDERAAVADHLSRCPTCRSLSADLGRIRNAARTLGPIAPPEDVWRKVDDAVRGARVEGEHGETAPRGRHAAWSWLGVAAALLIVTSVAYVVRGARTFTPAPAVPAARTTPAPGATDASNAALELDAAFAHYQRAIADLDTLRKTGGPSADPAVDAAIDRNLDAIDRAIAESRTALAADPESAPARDSLLQALQQKVGVLETTVALVNQMRQGNDDGAARAAGMMRNQS